MIENKHTPQGPETLRSPIDQAFLDARERLIEVSSESESTHDEVYWQQIRDAGFELGQDETLDGIEAYATVLMFSLPSALQAETTLKETYDPTDRRQKRLETSRFNNLIREFASNYPDVTADTLMAYLMQAAHVTVATHSSEHADADWTIRSIVRGAQHELAFAKLLEKTGLTFRPAHEEEDLKGADYIVTLPDGRTIKVDVKSSIAQIETTTPNAKSQGFVVDHRGDLVTYSYLTDKELGSKFTVSDDIAEARCGLVLAGLHQASLRKAS